MKKYRVVVVDVNGTFEGKRQREILWRQEKKGIL